MSNNLLGIVRDEKGKAKRLVSNSSQFVSDRYLDSPLVGITHQWIRDKTMKAVPLYLTPDEQIEAEVTSDYGNIPAELRETLQKGVLRTSGDIRTDYSVLMPVAKADDGHEEGRTGIILYKGEPVVVDIGGKDFVVEIKGVGRPDGNNDKIVLHERTVSGTSGKMMLGSLGYGDGKHEYETLELSRTRGLEDFVEGNTPRALAIQRKGIVGILYRLSPSNVRVSYKENSAFNNEIDPKVLVEDIARQWADLAMQDELLVHSNIHPENILFTGNGYSLTDYADVERLEDKLRDMSGKQYLGRVINKIKETREVDSDAEKKFYSEIARRLGVVGVAGDYDNFIDSIWKGYFAERVYRKLEGRDDRAVKKTNGWKKALQTTPLNDGTTFFAVEEARNYFLQEVELLEPVGLPVAKRSLALAREKLTYLEGQLKDTTDFRKRVLANPEKLYDFFVLPYMRSK